MCPRKSSIVVFFLNLEFWALVCFFMIVLLFFIALVKNVLTLKITVVFPLANAILEIPSETEQCY